MEIVISIFVVSRSDVIITTVAQLTEGQECIEFSPSANENRRNEDN